MSPGGTFRKFLEFDWFVFTLIFCWKIALLIFTAQPIPAGDAFFYDGAVVNHLNGGAYCNPSLALVLPISGGKVFSAYPPLYQGLLWVWMSIFGPKVIATLWLHLVLFGVFALAVLGIFRQLRVSAFWSNIACLFFLVNTFHDRPDSLAFALGAWAVWAWYRAKEGEQSRTGNRWDWLAAILVVLTLATSLQIGLLFIFWSGLLILTTRLLPFHTVPWLPSLFTLLVPVALVLWVKFAYPGLWQGFLEHVAQTPTLGGLQASGTPGLLKSYVLKAMRTAPALIVIGGFVMVFATLRRFDVQTWLSTELGRQLLVTLAAGGLLLAVGFFSLTPNPLLWTAYPQSIAVGIFGASFMTVASLESRYRFCVACLIGLAGVGAVRAVGMTTWGVACARDVTRATAARLLKNGLASSPSASTVVLSSAYLYDAASDKSHRIVHADWLVSYRQESDLVSNMVKQMIALKPYKLILTQFDFYRRYGAVLERLQAQPALVEVRIVNSAKVRAPDSYPSVQRLVQHVSWAPVIVEFNWK